MGEPKTTEDRRVILIAMPTLEDPNFSRTATLISEFNKDGAMGLVLNRPLNLLLDQVLDPETGVKSKGRVRVFWGGPVQPERGWIVHEDASLAAESFEVAKGLYMSSSIAALKKMAEEDHPPGLRFRFFLGYAGWGPGQLEYEMSASSWVTAPVARELIFDAAPVTLWERSLQSIGVDPIHLAAGSSTTIQ